MSPSRNLRLLSPVLLLFVLVAPCAEAAVIYTYEGHRLNDLPPDPAFPLKNGPFDGLDQVTGWIVLNETLPDRTYGYPSGLEGFRPLAWSFSAGDKITFANDIPGASGAFELSTFSGRIFAWHLRLHIPGWDLDSWEFSETISQVGGPTSAKFDVIGASWRGPKPFLIEAPEPVGLVSLALLAALARRRIYRRAPVL